MTRRLGLALVAMALLASSCGSRVREDVWADLEAQDGSTTATTSSAGGGDQPSDSGAAVETTRTTTARKGSSKQGASTATTAAGALPAPADGTYTYDQTDDGEKSSTTEKWAAQRGADSVTLTSVETEQDEEDTVTNTSKFRVTRSALEMLSQTSTYNDEDPETCTYKPPVLVLQLPLKIGDKWTAKGTCSEDGPADAADEENLKLEVTGTTTDTIGGQAVRTFVVKGTQSFDSTDDTTGERTTFTFTDTRHIDPATLLVVVEDVTFDFGGDGSTIHRQLRSLTPA